MLYHMKLPIETQNAPAAIGCYTQAIQAGTQIYCSGQIALEPRTMTLVEGGIENQIKQVFENLKNVALAAGASLDAIVKLTVYLIDINHLSLVNEIMPTYFKKPYPARTSIAVAALPKNALIEIEAILHKD